MKKPRSGWRSFSRLFALLLAFCFMGNGPQWSVSSAEAAKKKRRRTRIKFRRGGYLFLAQKAFPTSAEDIRGFIKLGKKHRKRSFRWSKNSDLTLKILLILKRAYRTPEINYVLFEKGKKVHVSSQTEALPKGKVQLHASTLNLNASTLKKGKKYELRVTVVRKRRRTYYVTVLARTFFRIR